MREKKKRVRGVGDIWYMVREGWATVHRERHKNVRASRHTETQRYMEINK